MGIDPNNHKLSQSLPRLHQNPQHNSSSATSSGPKTNANPPLKPRRDNDQVSDAGSCLEDDEPSGLPDLNLDLTISIPSDSSLAKIEDEKKLIKNNNDQPNLKEQEFAPSPTLCLFQ